MATKTPFQELLLVSGIFLLLIFGLGVTWKIVAGRQPVSAAESAVIAEQSDLMTRQLQDQLTDQLASQPLHEEQERIDSPMGLALLRKCLEWTEFHDNHPDQSTRSNRDQACADYAEFVDSGTVPQ